MIISVIIPHLNQPVELSRCLRSLSCQTFDPDSLEIIVVDNGSAELPSAIVARHLRARLIGERTPGPGPARNAGAREATGQLLAFIDADCRADPRWLESIARTLEAAPPLTILGGDVRLQSEDGDAVSPVEAYETVFAYRFKHYIEKQGYCGTGNLAVRRDDFFTIGPFAGIHIAEDMDWGQRARAAGYRFRYTPEMIVFHPARRSLGELYAKWDRQLHHYRTMAQAKPGWRWRWTARALAVFVSPAVDVFKVLTSDRLNGSRARYDAIKVLCAIRTHRALRMAKMLQDNQPLSWNKTAAS